MFDSLCPNFLWRFKFRLYEMQYAVLNMYVGKHHIVLNMRRRLFNFGHNVLLSLSSNVLFSAVTMCSLYRDMPQLSKSYCLHFLFGAKTVTWLNMHR